VPSYSTLPPPPQAPTYRVPAYGSATPGAATGVDGRFTVGAPAQVGAPSPSSAPSPGDAPSQVSPDGRTTIVTQPNGVTRVVVRTPGNESITSAPVKPMMSPADAANVIRRP
jgi:hypothetical protein